MGPAVSCCSPSPVLALGDQSALVKCSSPHHLQMALLNVRSLRNKTFLVNDIITSHKLNCIFLIETWLDSSGNYELLEASPSDFSFAHCSRSHQKGGGVAALFSHVLPCKTVSFGTFSAFEYLALRQSNNFLIVTVYHPPQYRAGFISEFGDFLSNIVTRYDCILISGDFNIHVDNMADSFAIQFTDLLTSFEFIQHISAPTHSHGHTLDLVISKGLEISINGTLDVGFSDHLCIFFSVSWPTTRYVSGVKTLLRRRIREDTSDRFIITFNAARSCDLSQVSVMPTPISPMGSVCDSAVSPCCDTLVNSFNSSVTCIMDSIAPLQIKTILGKRRSPWRTSQNISTFKRTCRFYERKWRKSKLQADFVNYKNHILMYNGELKKARRQYFSQIIAENSNNSKILFNTIDKLINPPLTIPTELHSVEKCNEFATFFSEKILTIRSNIKIPSHTDASYLFPSRSLLVSSACLPSFTPIHQGELGEIVQQLGSATCSLDPLPTKLLKQVFSCLASDILNIVNTSLLSGTFPSCLKHALVTPLLKKHTLDPLACESYRPISNLPFLCKILEKVVYKQLYSYLSHNTLFDAYQSGFRVNHSTETALVRVINDFKIATDNHKVSVLVLLDLSAAFDTVDHTILIQRLQDLIGIRGTALAWISSYLNGRSFSVTINNFCSDTMDISYGVPQGSILGPLLFNLYMLPLGSIIRRHNISYHSYADDTQLYISFSPDDPSPVNDLISCISDIKNWMAQNFLLLNDSKTEILVVGPKARREHLCTFFTPLLVKPCGDVRNLGVTLDSDLNFEKHISLITKTAFYHLRNISKVRSLLSFQDSEKLVHAFIFSRLDYCNSLYAGLTKQAFNKLQLIQNAAARILTRTSKFDHITPILKSLHWLPVKQRIQFKILLITFKAVNGLAPTYISDIIPHYHPTRFLRSSSQSLLSVPRINTNTAHGAFSYCAPTLWNSLPLELRSAQSTPSFKKALKTYLFSQAFG